MSTSKTLLYCASLAFLGTLVVYAIDPAQQNSLSSRIGFAFLFALLPALPIGAALRQAEIQIPKIIIALSYFLLFTVTWIIWSIYHG